MSYTLRPESWYGMSRPRLHTSVATRHDAGHMVPRDQPAVALAMLNAFLDDTLARA